MCKLGQREGERGRERQRWSKREGEGERQRQSKRGKRLLSLCIPPLLGAGALSLQLPQLFMRFMNGGADITGIQVTLHLKLPVKSHNK